MPRPPIMAAFLLCQGWDLQASLTVHCSCATVHLASFPHADTRTVTHMTCRRPSKFLSGCNRLQVVQRAIRTEMMDVGLVSLSELLCVQVVAIFYRNLCIVYIGIYIYYCLSASGTRHDTHYRHFAPIANLLEDWWKVG